MSESNAGLLISKQFLIDMERTSVEYEGRSKISFTEGISPLLNLGQIEERYELSLERGSTGSLASNDFTVATRTP